MTSRVRFWLGPAITVGLIALAALIGPAPTALASHTPCDNEGVAGGDVGNDFGPGVLYVGVDALGDASVCVSTGAPLTENNESVTVDVEDPNSSTPGATAAVTQRSCTDQAGANCTSDDVVGQTGVENPGATPNPDAPGGGTAGAGLTVTSDCIWVDGTANCGGASSVSVTMWEAEAPGATDGGCLLDTPPAGCDVQGKKVTAFGTPDPFMRVSRSGLAPVPDGNTDGAPPPQCIGAGTTCP